MADDPWHVVKNEISTTLAKVERLHAAASGLSGPAARPHLEKLESCLTAAELDLQDLEETISIVEAERARFPIADAELDARRAFVRSTAASIAAARQQVAGLRGAAGASASASASIAPARELGPESESEGLLSGASKPSKAAAKAAAKAQAAQARRQQAAEAANDRAVAHLGQQQQMEIEAQDEVLDDLHGAVSRVKSMAGQMHEELASHNRMIGTSPKPTLTLALALP